MAKKRLLLLGLLPFALVSLAFGQDAPNPSAGTAPNPASRAPRAAPAARLVGGIEIVNLKDAQDMSLPYNRYPGLQFRTSQEFFTQYPDRSKVPSGLYLMDTELVPPQLPQILTRNGVALGQNGTIVNNKGDKVVLLVGYKLVAIPKRQGSLPGSIFGMLAPRSAFAASPFPLEWVSAWYSWNDDEGFCRSITATTGGDAWGPVIDPWGDRVHTSIQQIEVYANAAGAANDRLCNNCAWAWTQETNNFGCFWPAHGGGEWGWADLKDGGFNWSYNW